MMGRRADSTLELALDYFVDTQCGSVSCQITDEESNFDESKTTATNSSAVLNDDQSSITGGSLDDDGGASTNPASDAKRQLILFSYTPPAATDPRKLADPIFDMLQSTVSLRKRRQRPVCLFINYLGSRQGTSQQQLPATVRITLETSKEMIPAINSAALEGHDVIDPTAEVPSPPAQKSTSPFYRLMCPCKLKLPVHLTNLKSPKDAMPPVEKQEKCFNVAIPVHLNNLKLPTQKLPGNSLSCFQVEVLSEMDSSSETYHGEPLDVALEPSSKKQKVVQEVGGACMIALDPS